MEEGKKPLKAKNLKIIDHLGTLYATFDGIKYWKLEKYIYLLLQECDGTKTLEEFADKIVKKSGVDRESILLGIRPIFEEFERVGFITYM